MFDNKRKNVGLPIYWLLQANLVLYRILRFVFYYLILEAATFTRKPANPTVVVEGVNSSRVPLRWNFALDKGESLRSVTIERSRPGDKSRTRIATRLSANDSFIFARSSYRTHYAVRLPATLVLKDVRRNDEYIYTLEIFYSNGVRNARTENSVSIVVFGEYYNCSFNRFMFFNATL